MASLIELRGLAAGYRRRAVLADIDLRVEAGESLAVLGPNGSGKSTLLLVLSGLLAPLAGGALFRGESIAAMRPRERAKRIAAVPQRAEAPDGLTVGALVLMGRYPHVGFLSGYAKQDRAAAREAMAAAGVEALAARRCSELSGGELQRAFIARALAQEPELLLLDEASAGLDIGRKTELHDLLRERNRRGLTIVSVVHDLNLAAMYCSRLAFLRQGRKVLDGSTRQVFTQTNLERVYEARVTVLDHPWLDVPQCLLLPGHVPSAAAGDGSPGADRNH